MKKIIILLLILSCAAGLIAQSKADKETAETVRKIKLADNQYWWDEVTISKTWLNKNPQQKEILRQGLKLGIGNKIKSYVYGFIKVNETETNGYSSSHSQRSVMVSSNLYLKNLGYYEFQKDKKQYTLFAYINRSDFWAQEDETIARINHVVEEARRLEAEKQSDYLYPYYRAYLMSYNVTRSFQGSNGEKDMQLWLENKLYAILKGISIQTKVTAGSKAKDKLVELRLDCQASSYGLQIELPSLGFNKLAVTDGTCKLFYPAQPSHKIEEYQLNLMIDPTLVATEPEIGDLAKQRPISVPKTIKLDFSFLFKLDFSYQIEDMKVDFNPSYGDISVISVDWDLGDGTKISSLEPFEHQYLDAGNYSVSMLVNGEYPVVKQLSIKSGVKAEEPAEQVLKQITEPVEAKPEPVIEKPEPVEIEVSPVIPAPEPLKVSSTIAQTPEPSENRNLQGMELRQYLRVRELVTYLDAQKAERKLTWGKLTRKSNLDNAWLVISEQDGTIIAILQPQTGGFYDLLSNQTVKDVFATYQGKAAIYISYF